jgi:hypothetical protein
MNMPFLLQYMGLGREASQQNHRFDRHRRLYTLACMLLRVLEPITCMHARTHMHGPESRRTYI